MVVMGTGEPEDSEVTEGEWKQYSAGLGMLVHELKEWAMHRGHRPRTLRKILSDTRMALHKAAEYGEHDLVGMIVSKEKVDVNALSAYPLYPLGGPWKLSALGLAVWKGHENVVDVLLNAPRVKIDSFSRHTILHLAADSGSEAIFEKIVTRVVNVKVRDPDGVTALHKASAKGLVNIVEILLNAASEQDVNVGSNDPDTTLHFVNVQTERDNYTPLHLASECGHEAVVAKLLATRRVEVNREDVRGATALHKAAKGGHVNIVEILLNAASEQDVNVNVQTERDNYTPLHLASECGHEAVVAKLLATRRVEVNREDVRGATALHKAAKGGHVNIVEILLNAASEQDANVGSNDPDTTLHFVNVQTAKGHTPLHLASEYGHEAVVVKLLATRRVEVNREDVRGATALHKGAKGGHVNVVEILLNAASEQDANVGSNDPDTTLHFVNVQTAKGHTPLHLASEYGHEAVVVKLLATRRVEVNREDVRGATALHKAAKGGHVDILNLLLKEPGVKVDIRSNLGTPLHVAAFFGREDFVDKLLAAVDVEVDGDTFVNAKNRFGNTALHVASRYGQAAVVAKLLEAPGIKVDGRNRRGETALHEAAENGRVNVVNMLLASPQVHVNATNTSDETPLRLVAIYNGRLSIVDELLILDHIRSEVEQKVGISPLDCAPSGADVNATDDMGRTPLHLAGCKGHEEVVEQLLKMKLIRSTAEDNAGKTPLEHALDNKREGVEKLLLGESAVKDYIENLYRDRQVYVDAANAILVGAALIATVTFASWLQPPLGYTTYYGEQYSDPFPAPPTSNPQYASLQHHKVLQAFWVCNSLSFFSSIAAVISGALSVLPSRMHFIKTEVKKLRRNLLITGILLVFSTAFVLSAFGLAGIIVVPPVPRYRVNAYATTYIGGLCCSACLVLFVNTIWDEWPTASTSKRGQGSAEKLPLLSHSEIASMLEKGSPVYM